MIVPKAKKKISNFTQQLSKTKTKTNHFFSDARSLNSINALHINGDEKYSWIFFCLTKKAKINEFYCVDLFVVVIEVVK